ncbi:unnamed protein product [Durusdinium trenchii]|uniref:Uncharacterized protein n=1 Tax=Durusdinium trenchii TaxID=1381693 RepID=A0ABP0SND6_9DINO
MEQFEPQSLASSAWALAKLSPASRPVWPLWEALARRSVEQIWEFDPRGLSNSAWSCATLRCRDGPLLSAVWAAATPRMTEFDEQALSTTLWALAKLLEHKVPGAASLSGALLAEVRGRSDLPPQGLANISWACATLRASDQSLMEALATQGSRRLRELQPQHVSNMA